MQVVELNRTLEQELLALSRGASLECPACGEFVLLAGGGASCPEGESRLAGPGETAGAVQLRLEAG